MRRRKASALARGPDIRGWMASARSKASSTCLSRWRSTLTRPRPESAPKWRSSSAKVRSMSAIET
jgi:hypothetical protein